MPPLHGRGRLAVRLIVGAVLLQACQGAPPATTTGDATPPAVAAFDEKAWRPPSLDSIPSGPLGTSIRRGLALVRNTHDSLPTYATAAMSCTSCHQEDGLKLAAAPLTGSHARYPKYMPRAGAVITLAERVNYCFTRSMAGNALPVNSREMEDILALLAYMSRGVPVGTMIAGSAGLLPSTDTLVGDIARGEQVFTQECVACHQADGQGLAGTYPPLWGAKSYSIGASMAREERAASFIFHNMPKSQPGKLTLQQAFDVAAFVNSHPRPDSPGKEDDWPAGDAPSDVPYRTKGHEPKTPPAVLPRSTPEFSRVPNPVAAPPIRGSR